MRLQRITNNIGRRQAKLERELRRIPKQAHDYFVKVTPKKTGNARSKTKFNAPDTISAEYNYANRLNEGWSRQARDGMTKPTIKYIRALIKRI